MDQVVRPTQKKPSLLDNAVILDALPHPVIVVDASDHICFVNAASELFFHTSSLFLLQLKIRELISPDHPLISLIEQIRSSNSSINEYNVEFSTPRIHLRQVDILVSTISEIPNHILILLQDRGMADRMNRQLTHRDSARSVSGMAAVLAHEIKNPLASIRGAAQLLEQSLPAEEAGMTALIRDEADRICKLVDRMEGFATPNTTEFRPVNIHAVLDRVEDIAKTSFGANLTILKNYDPSLPALWGEHDQLIQVFLNLMSNAADAVLRQHGSQEALIRMQTAYRQGVRISLPGSRNKIDLPLEVSISDNGPGIPDDILSNMFDPFVTSKPRGQGLGLALVAKIVRDHGGIVDCDSSPNGTTFRVLLPIADVSEPHLSSREGAGHAEGR